KATASKDQAGTRPTAITVPKAKACCPWKASTLVSSSVVIGGSCGVHLIRRRTDDAAAPPRPKSTGSRDPTRPSPTDDGAGYGGEYRDAAQRAKSVGAIRVRAGERHENIAGDRIYRDRMRT